MNYEPSPDEVGRLIAKLTPAERRCLRLVAQGLTSKVIGRELQLAPNTVDAYLKSAAKKLGVQKRSLAAQMLASVDDPTTPNLVYGNLDVPDDANFTDKEASAGKGDGLDDLGQREPPWSEFHDSERGRAWLEPNHPIAKFFGGENRLSIGQRVIRIVLMAIGLGIAFGGVISGLASLSRVFSAP